MVQRSMMMRMISGKPLSLYHSNFIIFVIIAVSSSNAFSQFRFEDATASAKIHQTSIPMGDIGGGVVVLDVNNDGWEDLYLPGTLGPDKLYLNQKDGTFQDIADSIFASHEYFSRFTHGGVAFDYNSDGFTDLFEVCRRDDLLWKNNGDGTFSNTSKIANIQESFDENISNGVTFGDMDGDGDNDIYVARWMKSIEVKPDSFGISRYYLHGFPNHLYVNNDDGTFVEKAISFGVDNLGTSNVATMFDYDKDGDLDILLGNDFGMVLLPNEVYQNQFAQTGVVSFNPVAKELGLDLPIYSMTVTPNDFDNDGDFDFHYTSIGAEYLMKNENGKFSNVAQQLGFQKHVTPADLETPSPVTWTALYSDFDNDGRSDVFVVHGYLMININTRPGNELDTSRFYHQQPDGTLKDVTLTNGVVTDIRGRGAAVFDYDRDGRLDIIMGSINRIPGVNTADFRLFHNITPVDPSRNWVQIQCLATTTAREAIGTTVEVWCKGKRYINQINSGGGMSSGNSLILHFGVADATIADSIILYWPMSKDMHRQVDRYYNVLLNRQITYQEQPRSSVSDTIGNEKMFTLYPSVTSKSISISGADNYALTSYQIVNLLGEVVLEISGRKPTVELLVSTVPPGSYFVKINSTRGQYILRFIKI